METVCQGPEMEKDIDHSIRSLLRLNKKKFLSLVHDSTRTFILTSLTPPGNGSKKYDERM
jgi:hypothetical protein